MWPGFCVEWSLPWDALRVEVSSERYGVRVRLLLLSLMLVVSACQLGADCGDGELAVQEFCFAERDGSSGGLLALGDVDQDGRTDAVMLLRHGEYDDPTWTIAIRPGQADGTFGEPGPGMPVDGVPAGVAVGDADAEPGHDVVIWSGNGRVCGYAPTDMLALQQRWCVTVPGRLYYWGYKIFEPIAFGSFGAQRANGVVLQGVQEIVVITDPSATAVIERVALPDEPLFQLRPLVADLDGDGRDEVLSLEPRGARRDAILGQESERIASRLDAWDALVGDFDGDEIDDLVLIEPRAGSILVEFVLSGSTRHRIGTAEAFGLAAVEVADVDADGADDLILHGNDYRHGYESVVFWGAALERGRATPSEVGGDGFWGGLRRADVNGDGLEDFVGLAWTDLILHETDHVPRIFSVWINRP